MLVLTRRPMESLQIGRDITVTVAEIRGPIVKLAISAPADIQIVRDDAKKTEPRQH